MVWRQKPRKLFLEKLFSTYQPRKLYCGLRVEFNQIILHVWQGGRKLTPAKYEYNFNEFRSNNSMLELIQLQLGPIWLSQLLALITGKGSSLLDMPESFLQELAQYFSISDLLRVSSTCKYMNKFYSADAIWKSIFEKFLRYICSYSDYTHVQINGGFKQVCHRICRDNKDKEQIKRLLYSDQITVGSSQAKMFLSFSSNRFDQFSFGNPKQSQSSPLLECEENFELPRANKSESRIYFDQESILKSQSYLTGVSHSTSSFAQCSDRDDFQRKNGETIEGTCSMKLFDGNCMQIKDDFHFNKSDLMRRLNYLSMKTKQYACEENFLPGDRTLKFALKYRE